MAIKYVPVSSVDVGDVVTVHDKVRDCDVTRTGEIAVIHAYGRERELVTPAGTVLARYDMMRPTIKISMVRKHTQATARALFEPDFLKPAKERVA